MKWFLLIIFGVLCMSFASAEIINSRTEHEPGKYTFYTKDKFYNNGKEYLTFEDFSDSKIVDYTLVFDYEDGTQINLTPFGIYKRNKYYVKDLDSSILNQIDFNNVLSDFRDYSKFTIEFNRIKFLTDIGFKFSSNKPILEIPQEYTEEGVFNLNEEEPEIYRVTDLKAGNVIFSYLDLLQTGNSVLYSDYEITIDISDREENSFISLDPGFSTYSPNVDGYFTYGVACTNADDSAATMYVSFIDPLGLPPARQSAVFDYDTSALADDITVTDLRLYLYVTTQAYRLPRGVTPSDWNTGHRYKNTGLGAGLTCADFGGFSASFHTEDLIGTGQKNYSISDTSKVNLAGYSTYQLIEGWASQVADRYQMSQQIASTENPTFTEPKLEVYYNVPAAAAETVVTKQKKQVYPLAVLMAMFLTGFMVLKNGKKEESD